MNMDTITIKNPIDGHHSTIYSGNDKREEYNCQVESLAQVSDGYHSIQELYDHRITLFIALCRCMESGISQNQQAIMGREAEHPMRPWRSKTHYDGTSWDGWFIMGIGKEKGEQISYHLPLSRWDETDFAETLEKAPPFDGHTSADVLERLKQL